MATAGTAPPLTIQPPAIEPLSDDDGSSPLSDLGGSQNDLELPDDSPRPDRDEPSDDEGNDTEAETERLFPTPHNPTRHTDALGGASTFERTPTKLRQGTRVDDDEDEPLSELQGSFTSSPPRAQSSGPPSAEKLPSPTLDILAEAAAAAQFPDVRKRKRSSQPPDNNEEDQSPRKRSASPSKANRADQDGDVTMADDEDPSTNTTSGDEAVVPSAMNGEHDEQGDEADAEAQIEEESRAQRQSRSGSKRKAARAESDEPMEEAADGTTVEEDGPQIGEDEQAEADVDEEAEAAQRTEEELERKKAAFDMLTGIERQFSTFRERLYEERLDQLNREEAMLKADNPTHPDYLAMMECIDARRDDKLRIAENEFALNTDTLGRWAVARRAQIHSQYYQDVRETRERIIGDLGKYWYAIQHERRKHANNVHEFGLRFPQTQSQRVRDAMAYNKEVAILSGIAKYEGMPAAPEMRGASLQEFDDDFEAMTRGRGPVTQPHEPARSVYSDIRGIPPFGQGLSAAAEQFIEQNAWANPRHPSNAHLLQRQHSQHEPRRRSPPPETSSSRRHSHQRPPFSSSTISTASNLGSLNANTTTSNHVPRAPTTSPETTRAASLLEQTSVRSMKAAAAAAAVAAAAEVEQRGAVHREAAPPVGGF
ncbi:Sds3-like-domain-containing protein [Pestalotiopsis sp. NC0098]|nr:Sds3-like-domain-containing protein [Pestalotiopsis sp. NC0098]